MKPRNTQLALLSLFFSASLSTSTLAQSVWDGDGGDNNWSTGDNWGGTAPTPGTSTALQFAGSTQTTTNNDFAANSAFGSITFNADAGSFILGGNAINLNGNIVNASSTEQQINFGINLTNNINVDLNSQTLVLNGGVSFNNRRFWLGQAGTLVLNGAGSGEGASAGVFSLNTANGNGLNYTISRVNVSNVTLELGNATGLGAGAVQFNGNGTIRANIALTGASSVGNTFVIGNASNMTIGGSQNIQLSGNSQKFKDTNGVTTRDGGAIIAASNGSTTRTLYVTNTGTTLISGDVYLEDGGNNVTTLNFDVASTAGATEISGAVIGSAQIGSASGNLQKSGTGVLTLSGTSTYTGTTTVSAGSLFVSGALGNTAVTVNNNAVIGAGDASGLLGGNLTIASGGKLDLTNGILTVSDTATVSFGNFGFSDLIGFDVETAAEGSHTILDGDFTLNSANIANFGAGNAYVRGDGKLAYFDAGSLQVVVIPEPHAALLGGFGILALLRRRRC